MINVVEVISDTNIGGAGRLLINKIKYSNKTKFKYTVVLPSGSSLIPLIKNEGASVVLIDGCRDRSFDLIGVFELYKIIKKISPDVLNSHACISARIAGKMAGASVNLYTRHCDFPTKRIFANRVVRNSVGAIDELLSDGAIAVSESAKLNLLALGVKEKNIAVIINGADELETLSLEERQKIRAGLEIPAEAFVVSIFARLEEYKDHKTFLRAAKTLKKYKNIYLLIVGSGSLDSELKKYAHALGLDNHVRFLGFRNDVARIMNITDVNVNCSVGTETSSLSLSEGMSIGIPAVVSDYSGNKYMVKNGVNGLVFAQGDYIALAKGILQLYSDKALYARLSNQAQKRFYDELNAARMIEETEQLYALKYRESKKRAIKRLLQSRR